MGREILFGEGVWGCGEGYWDIHHEAVLFSRGFIDIWRRMQFLNIEHGRVGGGTMDTASSWIQLFYEHLFHGQRG